MVSRNYNIQTNKMAALNAKSPNNDSGHSNALSPNRPSHNNFGKVKQNIHYKQASVGTQYSSAPNKSSFKDNGSPVSPRYAYSAALSKQTFKENISEGNKFAYPALPSKNKYEKPTTVSTYTSTINRDLSSKNDNKSASVQNESTSTFTYLPIEKESGNIIEPSVSKQRINCIDTVYQHYSPNIGNFPTANMDNYVPKCYKTKTLIQNTCTSSNSITVNNNLPTITESVIEDGEYPVDVQLNYAYATKMKKSGENASFRCDSGRDCSSGDSGNNVDTCAEGCPNNPKNSRFQYLNERPLEITDSLKGYHKYKYQGTHPDSLYRVAQFGGVLGGDGAKGVWSRRGVRVRNSCRLIRWPLALGALCIALALLVYFLMPKASPPLMVPDNLNSSEWLLSEEQFSKQENSNKLEVNLRAPNDPKRNENLQDSTVIISPADSTSTKPPEITSIPSEIYIDENIGGEDGLETFLAAKAGTDPSKDIKQTSASPSPPIFPTNISPSVQYGNEHQDADSNEKRTPKIAASELPVTDLYDNKFLTQTFAIFFNKDAAKDPSSPDDSASKTSDESVDIVLKSGAPSFTSGHQNSFGLSIEESSKPQSTTQSAVYNTKVSPTLPSMVGKNKVRSTTVRSRWNSTEDGDGICHSTRLSMCRGVLPYDLTTQPLVSGINSASQLDAAVPYFDYIVRSGCSPRARQFICSLLEPECKPRGMTVTPPCRRACKAVAESCQDVISATLQLSQVFNCVQYPDGGDCLQRGGGECLAGELRCPADGSCIPLHWRCDNIPDCPGGTDEVDCDGSGCAPSEFKCGGRGSCIPEEWVCDGHRDCPQAEDEADCGAADVVSAASRYPVPVRLPRPSPRPLLNTVTGPSIFTATSRNNQEYESGEELLMMSDSFAPIVEPVPGKKAPSSSPRKPKTDATLYTLGAIGKLTLKNAAKAQGLKTEAPPTTESPSTIVTMQPDSKCKAGESNCQENSEGRSPDVLEEDYYSDEYTSHSSPCPKGELRCVDGRCITLAQLCDKQPDCSDGADEANCFL